MLVTFIIVFVVLSFILPMGSRSFESGFRMNLIFAIVISVFIWLTISFVVRGRTSIDGTIKSGQFMDDIRSNDRKIRANTIETLSNSPLHVQIKSLFKLIDIQKNKSVDEEVLKDIKLAINKIKSFLILYSSNDSHERKELAKALIKIDDEDSKSAAAKNLAANLAVDNKEIRKDAIKSLTKLAAQGNNKSIEILTQTLSHKSFNTRLDAYNSLEKIGSASVEPLVMALKEDNIKKEKNELFAIQATRILGKIRDPRAVDVLVETLQNQKQPKKVRKRAIKAISRIGDKKALEPLQIALEKEESSSIQSKIKNAMVILEMKNNNEEFKITNDCPDCKTENLDDAIFCQNCGKELKELN